MAALGLCTSCRYGMHDKHQKIVQPCPPGMCGGIICPCEGDCTEPEWFTKFVEEVKKLQEA